MNSAEQKVRERYPEAFVSGTRDRFWRVWTKPFPPSPPYLLGIGDDEVSAWESALAGLPAAPATMEEQ